jgi:hypothetical protein
MLFNKIRHKVTKALHSLFNSVIVLKLLNRPNDFIDEIRFFFLKERFFSLRL